MTQASRTAQAGTLDPTFAHQGLLDWPIAGVPGTSPVAVIALPDGKLIAASFPLEGMVGFAAVRLTPDGKLDYASDFGDGQGFVEVSFPGKRIDSIFAGSRLSDGGLLFTAQYLNDGVDGGGLAVIRLLETGQLDAGFGDGGVVFLDPVAGGTPEHLAALKPRETGQPVAGGVGAGIRSGGSAQASGIEQPDGKIVVMTSAADFSAGTYKGQVVRLNRDGSFDQTFNGSGRAFVELPDALDSEGRGVALQRDGKLVVHGSYRTNNDYGLYVVRFNPDGRQDPGFANLLQANPDLLAIYDIRVRAKDDLIVLVGGKSESLKTGIGAILLLNRDGGFNLVFNNGQPLYSKLTDIGQRWSRCTFGGASDDLLIVSGTTGSEFFSENSEACTARYLMTGQLDSAFNEIGFVVFDDPQWLEATRGMTLSAQQRIVVCGGHHLAQVFNPLAGWMVCYLT
jgi:uncharacterized delta-60 repeat protein